LINDFQDYKDGNIDLDLLMSRSCDMIPHRTNPTMINVVSRIQEGFEASCYPSFANKFEKIRIISDQVMDGKITIYNLLGNPIAIRKVYFDQGENIEFFNTVDWNSGTYIIKIESGNTIQTTKFFIRH
jgi:hypothetical protein